MDLSAKNLDMFTTDHWLSSEQNCVVVRLTEPAWITPRVMPRATRAPQARMAQWSTAELYEFLESRDMAGPAAQLRSQGVNGADFVELTNRTLEKDLRCTPFTANKLIRLRQRFFAEE